MTKPSRPASNGRLARSGSSLRVESARRAANADMPTSLTAASAPPANIAVASPRRMMLKASPRALLPAAQAVQVALTGPLRPRRMELQAEAMLGIIMGMKKGLTRVGPLCEQDADLLVEGVEAAHARADEGADRIGVFGDGVAGVLQRHAWPPPPRTGRSGPCAWPSSCR